MRSPSGILFLLACVLAAPPLIHRGGAQELCASEGLASDDPACVAITPPQPGWMDGMEFLAVLSFVGGAVTGGLALRDRRREAELLRGAGVGS